MKVIDYQKKLTEKEVTIVCDDIKCWRYFSSIGYNTSDFSRGFNLSAINSECILLILTKISSHHKLLKLWSTEIITKIVIYIPSAKFSLSFQDIIYTFNSILKSCFKGSLERRSFAYKKILDASEPLQIKSSEQENLKVKLAPSIEIGNDDLKLKKGWIYSISEFFEASIVNRHNIKKSFNMNGTFSFEGVLFSSSKKSTLDKHKSKLKKLKELSLSSQDKKISIINNNISSLMISGVEHINIIRGFSYEFDYMVSEFSFGCNEYIVNKIDWKSNSMLNEGALGVHLGIGWGLEAPHIDFISTKLKI